MVIDNKIIIKYFYNFSHSNKIFCIKFIFINIFSLSHIFNDSLLKKNLILNFIDSILFSIITDRKIFQGILKPQGSLERNRDSSVNTVAETRNPETINSLPCARKPRQNIAMQTIMRRVETEQKQVTFKNVSPVIVEEESDKKAKSAITPSTSTCIANKSTPIPEMSKPCEPSTVNTLITVQSRLPMMSPVIVGQNQPTLVQNQQKTVKLSPNISISPQMNHVAGKDQSTPITQQMLPQMHAGITQCGQQPQTSSLGPVCYPNQSFGNMQNPQFAKNFMASQQSASGPPRYQMQQQPGQLNSNNQQSMAASISQTVGMHHTINQSTISRPFHQRIPQNVSHSPAQLMQQQQQNLRLGSPAQQSVMPQGMNLQTASIALQPGMSVEQQSHVIGLQQQQQKQTVMQSNVRPTNGMHNQLNVNNAKAITSNVSIMPALSAYNKDPVQQQQQQQITNLPNSPSPTGGASNFQLNFSQGNYNQSAIGAQALSQSQLSPSFYKSTDMMDFSFPNQASVKSQSQQQKQQSANNYMFSNYEPTEHFNLWNNSRPPQPPVAWWDLPSNQVAAHVQNSTVADTFPNWSNSSNPGNIASMTSMTPCKTYQQQPNVQHSRRLIAENNFEDSRLFEVSLVRNSTHLKIIYLAFLLPCRNLITYLT